MAENSKIEWTTHTLNLWWGCTEVHEGCNNCYARVLSNRWGNELWGNDAPRREINNVWKNLQRFQKKAEMAGEIHRVFVGSMMDIFEKPMPVIDSKGNKKPYMTDYIRNMFFDHMIPQCPNLLFLLLTKRPSNINKYTPYAWQNKAPDNVMFGTSVVNQQTADRLIPQLLEVPGKHFLSVEPQLDGIVFQQQWLDKVKYSELYPNGQIDWVIVGGESGMKRRPYKMHWARDIRDQCIATATPFFMKQIDKVIEIPDDLMIRQFPNTLSLPTI